MSTTTGARSRVVLLATLTTALVAISGPAKAKTPGSTYCFLSTCHRVLTLAETRAAVGKPTAMHASHYDAPGRDRFNPSLITSSGELFRPDAPNNAASPIYPDGTLVAVYAPTTKRGAIVRINNAGPYYGNRMIDLSRGLADKLGIAKSGVARVVVDVLAAPRPEDAKHLRGRRYAPVLGFIGHVAGIETVRATWQSRQGGQTEPVVIAAGLQPTVPSAAPSAAATSVARTLPPDDMRDLSRTASAPTTLPLVLTADDKRPAPHRKAAKPALAARSQIAAQHLGGKMPTPLLQ